jgi:SNF2 family DNA or RNA helicase
MNRQDAGKLTKDLLTKHGLADWHVRINPASEAGFLGMCSYKDKCIILNGHHVDMHDVKDVTDTILHEIAHALVGPNQGHNYIWAKKAEELGARAVACSHLSLPPHVIDAIRSGATVEIEYETIQIPKFKVTRLQDKCPECGKVAVEKFSVTTIDKQGNDCVLTTLNCFHIIKRVIPRGTPFDKMVSNDWKDEVKNCVHNWDKHQCMVCKEFRLMPFQVEGARFAESGLSMQKGVGIFDDMGLGKTVQTLAVVKFHPEYTPTLYIVKSAIKFQWFKQIIRWLGPAYMPQLISTSKDYIMPGLKSYVISYDLLRRFPREKLLKVGFKLVILDECQQIKNPDSSRTQEVRAIVGSSAEIKVLPISGTPWKNRGGEFFPVLNMLSPQKFHSQQDYLDRWVDYYFDGNTRKQGGIKRIEKFREYTKDLIIRREYNEVMDEFPDINRMFLPVKLDALSQDSYNEEVTKFVEWYNEKVIGGEEMSSIELLGKMARMRHLTGLAKIPATMAFVDEFVEETDRKLVIFVHHQDVGQILYDEIRQAYGKTMLVCEFTGTMSDGEKFTIAENFNKASRAIMIASTLAAGEGVDLQTCSDSVLHERQWNPQNEDQATPGRFRRIGQTAKGINITVPEAEGTIDEHVGAIVENKRVNFHKAMNKSELPVWSESSFAKQLAENIVAAYSKQKVA